MNHLSGVHRLAHEVVVADALRERCFGQWEGLSSR